MHLATTMPSGVSMTWLISPGLRANRAFSKLSSPLTWRAIGLMRPAVAARDGLAQMKDDLARYAPHINPEIVDHPDFPEFFRPNAANFPHHFLDDPQGRVAIAGMTSAFLDPNKQPRPRDDKGRFAGGQSAAEALVNRQFLAANAPSQGGRSQAAMGVTVSREDEAFLRGMERHTGTMSSAELSALEYTDIENYRRAMSKGQQRGRR